MLLNKISKIFTANYGVTIAVKGRALIAAESIYNELNYVYFSIIFDKIIMKK